MDKVRKLGMVFDSLAEELNITNTMLDKAETAYNALGEYIKSANDEWDVAIYPQGSFELGTVIKPLNEDEQYDVDLVVLVKHPYYDAETLRKQVLELLKNHGRYEGKIENKKPCIRIQYADSAQFHMDIASAQDTTNKGDTSVNIARFDGEDTYYYDISNPKGYVEWFKKTMQFEELQKSRSVLNEYAQTDVQELKLSRMRTPLQKAVQILKRHRDIYFANRYNSDDRPSSIIITTLCAKAYEDTRGQFQKENVYLTVVNMINQFQYYIKRNSEGKYYLENPSNTQENFLKKWNDNPNLVLAFREWITKAQEDIIYNPENFIEDDPRKLRKVLYESFGQRDVDSALNDYGIKMGEYAKRSQFHYDKQDANVVLEQKAGIPYKPHTYFGGEA